MGHTGPVVSVAWSPDGKCLASGGESAEGMIRIWDAGTGKETRSIRTGYRVFSLAWDSNSVRLAASGARAVVLWDATTGEKLVELPGSVGPVEQVALSPDGKRVAVADFESAVKIWDLAAGQQIRSLRGHTSRPVCLAWSPDGKRLASAGSDLSVSVWDLSSQQEAIVLSGHTGGPNSLAWSPTADDWLRAPLTGALSSGIRPQAKRSDRWQDTRPGFKRWSGRRTANGSPRWAWTRRSGSGTPRRAIGWPNNSGHDTSPKPHKIQKATLTKQRVGRAKRVPPIRRDNGIR